MPLTVEEIEKILQEALPHVLKEDIHKAAQALLKVMSDWQPQLSSKPNVEEAGTVIASPFKEFEGTQWQEVDLTESLGAMLSVQCRDICAIGKAYEEGFKIRAFIAPKGAIKT